MDSRRDDILSRWKNIDFPGSFSNVHYFTKALHRHGIPTKEDKVKKILATDLTYQTTRCLPKTFPKRKSNSYYFSQRWEGDLADIGTQRTKDPMTGQSRGRYILLYVDTFSKKVFLRGIKDKSAVSVLAATKDIFEELQDPYHAPYELITDAGKEFENRLMKAYLKEQGVLFRVAVGEHKARFAERYVRSLKKILIPYIESFPSTSWEEVARHVMQAMNQRFNRSLDMSPNDVPHHWQQVQKRYETKDPLVPFDQYLAQQTSLQNGGTVRDGKQTFAVGSKVFIPFKRAILDKESDRQYTYQVFSIKKILTDKEPYLYQLKDALGKVVKRLYYGRELRPATEPEFYPVSGVMKTRKRGRNKQFLVRWMDHDHRFDSWVKERDLKKL